MDASRFDAWSRRRFGLASGGTLATLLGLLRLDEAEGKQNKKKRRRKRKRKQKQKQKRREQRRNGDDTPPVDQPDILVIYVDDMREDDYAALPRTLELLRDQGATYPNFFLTTPLCSPSRASFFRGQYAHNTSVRNNQNGYVNFDAINEDTIATWLRGADPQYRTAHVGKHLNGYNKSQGEVGPGWTDWVVPMQVRFYNYDLNINGESEHYGSQPNDYLTDVMLEKAQEIITTTPEETPLFLYFAPKAPHGPSTPAERHIGEFDGVELDKGGSFNEEAPEEFMEDKPDYMQRPPLDAKDINAFEESNQQRLESLLSVDEAIEGLINTLDTAGRLDKTFIFFATDNGFLLGEHRRGGKNVPYEESIRMSMLLRGPGVRHGTNDAMVANIDLAPTIAVLAGVEPPGYVDGRSIVDTFDGSGNSREALLIEIFPEGEEADPEEEDILPAEKRVLAEQAEADTAIRAIRTADWLYVEIAGTGERELYDLNGDPFQLDSLHEDPEQSDQIQELSAWLATLRDCDAESCRNAEESRPPD